MIFARCIGLAAVSAMLACGARTPLGVSFAAVQDVPVIVRDASPGSCQLRMLSAPTVVYAVPRGAVEAPTLAARRGDYLAGALVNSVNNGPTTPLSSITPSGNSLRVQRVENVQSSQFPAGLTGNDRTALRCLGYRRNAAIENLFVVTRIDAANAETQERMFDRVPPSIVRCDNIALAGDEMFAFFTIAEPDETRLRPMLVHFDEQGRDPQLVRIEQSAQPIGAVNSASDINTDVTQPSQAVAWVTGDKVRRVYSVQTQRRGAASEQRASIAIEGGDPMLALPGIALTGAGATVAVALPGSGRVLSFGANGQQFRSDPVAIDMGAEHSPAIVQFNQGWLVAMLAYGDEDPTMGSLVIQQVSMEGRLVGGSVGVPIQRGGLSAKMGVVLATDGTTTIVHWTGIDRQNGQSSSFVMSVACR